MNIRKKYCYLRNKIISHYSWILMSVSIIASISAQSSDRNWILGSSGKVKWSKSCDFFGKDYAQKSGIITSKYCEELCVADNRCTHFTSVWTTGKCLLKTSGNSVMKVRNLNGFNSLLFTTVCGYVVDRVCITFKYIHLSILASPLF